jgi:hypothetical protein
MDSQPNNPANMKPAGQWNSLEVTVRGETLRARVNGESVLDTKLDPSAKSGTVVPGLERAKGRIGLQRHTGTVRFRKIEIKELPAKNAEQKSKESTKVGQAEPKLPRKVFGKAIIRNGNERIAGNGKWRLEGEDLVQEKVEVDGR